MGSHSRSAFILSWSAIGSEPPGWSARVDRGPVELQKPIDDSSRDTSHRPLEFRNLWKSETHWSSRKSKKPLQQSADPIRPGIPWAARDHDRLIGDCVPIDIHLHASTVRTSSRCQGGYHRNHRLLECWLCYRKTQWSSSAAVSSRSIPRASAELRYRWRHGMSVVGGNIHSLFRSMLHARCLSYSRIPTSRVVFVSGQTTNGQFLSPLVWCTLSCFFPLPSRFF